MKHQRLAIRVWSLAFLVCALLRPTALRAESTVIAPGSLVYQNIQTAIQFLRDHGESDAADEIQTTLDNGKFYLDTELKENAETSALDNVTLSPAIAAFTLPFNRDRAFDAEEDFERVLGLARTLYHENIHANHQNYGYWLYSNLTPRNDKEVDAWRQTIDALERWVRVEQEQFDHWYHSKDSTMSPEAERRELDKLNRKINRMTIYLGDYQENDYFGAGSVDAGTSITGRNSRSLTSRLASRS